MNIDDFMRSTNGPAYEAKEERYGPPLEYVGEKLRRSLESQHELLNNVENCVPSDLLLPQSYKQNEPISVKLHLLHLPAFASFYYQLVAFAALYNMLGSVGSSKDAQRLARLSQDELKKWLDFIEREGAVLGAKGV